MEGIILLLCVVNFFLIIGVFKLFTEITNNQNEIIGALNNDIQRLRDDGK